MLIDTQNWVTPYPLQQQQQLHHMSLRPGKSIECPDCVSWLICMIYTHIHTTVCSSPWRLPGCLFAAIKNNYNYKNRRTFPSITTYNIIYCAQPVQSLEQLPWPENPAWRALASVHGMSTKASDRTLRADSGTDIRTDRETDRKADRETHREWQWDRHSQRALAQITLMPRNNTHSWTWQKSQ